MAAKIIIGNNGSIKVEGEFKIYDATGNEYDLGGRTRVSLCRCGHSGTMPFCDRSHRSAGFVSECKAYALPPVQT